MDNLWFEFPAEVPWFSQYAPLQGTLGREGVATKASADTLGWVSKTHQLQALGSSLRSPQVSTVYHPAFPHCNEEALTVKPRLLGSTPVNTSFHCSQTLAWKCQQTGLVIFANVHPKLTGNKG